MAIAQRHASLSFLDIDVLPLYMYMKGGIQKQYDASSNGFQGTFLQETNYDLKLMHRYGYKDVCRGALTYTSYQPHVEHIAQHASANWTSKDTAKSKSDGMYHSQIRHVKDRLCISPANCFEGTTNCYRSSRRQNYPGREGGRKIPQHQQHMPLASVSFNTIPEALPTLLGSVVHKLWMQHITSTINTLSYLRSNKELPLTPQQNHATRNYGAKLHLDQHQPSRYPAEYKFHFHCPLHVICTNSQKIYS